ncbi:MAG: glycosyltransferase [Flavobacteriales bacterium]|nr:glycosyltransferase [Flavobacteriales bacterium]NQX96785.1 glycosyltransferase [Flavobacteriales bacterium]
MEIIHIILGKANPNRMNGVNKVVNSLATYQTAIGCNVSVWGITKNPIHNYPNRIYNTILFKETSKFFLPEGIKLAIEKKCRDAVFHFHGGFIPQFILIANLLVKQGFKYVFTPHGSYNTIAMERSNWKKKMYIWLFEKNLVKKAKSIHFIGKSEIDGAKKLFQLNNYQLIPNGQNLEELILSENSKKENVDPIFGFCGRLDIKTKGLDILLKGFAEYLTIKGGKGELWLIGDGSEKGELEELAQNLNIIHQVKFLGSIYGKQKIKMMIQFDYFMLTSRNEGLPGVVLEACALGVPSIVSKATNMGDYIDKNYAGITLKENTSTCVANAMQTALIWKYNGEISRIKQNAKKMVEQQFNWKNIAKQLLDIYA